MRRLAVLGSVGLVVLLTAGCEVRRFDLGVTGTGAPLDPQRSPSGSLAPAYGCGDWIDDELNRRRVGTCEGLCTDKPAEPYVLSDKTSIMAATAGRWAFCSDHLGPADALGMEFGPGCRIFYLRDDANGIAVRGTEADYQADYDIFDDGSTNIDLHFTPTHAEAFTVEAYPCPERVVLRQGDRVIELARLDGHGGTGLPVR